MTTIINRPRPARTLPTGPDIIYEPKWDGWRAIARDGWLWSRTDKPIEPAAWLPAGIVLDGELVNGLFIVWDILEHEGEPTDHLDFWARQGLLVNVTALLPVSVSPVSDTPAVFPEWKSEFGPWLDGIIAKNVKTGRWWKVKDRHTVDAVATGHVAHRSGPGNLKLSLVEDDGTPRYIGQCPGPADLVGQVVEVEGGQVVDGRFRHPAKLIRPRPDKPAGECTVDQLTV